MDRLAELSPEDKQFFDQHVFIQPPLTEKQQQDFQQFKERVVDMETDEVSLRRFFRARDCKIEPAETMLRAERVFTLFGHTTSQLKWRIEEAPKACLNETILRHLSFKTVEILPNVRDVYNRPLVVITGRYYNPELNMSDAKQMTDYFIWGMEIVKKLSCEPQPQFVLILDLEGWGLRNFNVGMANALAQTARQYYPDYMGQTFIVNYPWVVWGVWKMASMLLEQRTKDKIQFLSNVDAKRLFPVLFDKKLLYQRFGGDVEELEGTGSSIDEWNPQRLAEWQKMKRSENPEEQFKQKLEEFWETLSEEDQTFWKATQTPSNVSS